MAPTVLSTMDRNMLVYANAVNQFQSIQVEPALLSCMNELQEFREMHEAVFKSFSAVQQILNPVLEEYNRASEFVSVAECDGAVEKSRLDCNALCRCLKESNIQCCVSEIPTRYLCNAAYYHMLRKVKGNAVFIHIPTMKNMSGIMIEKIVGCMEEIERNI